LYSDERFALWISRDWYHEKWLYVNPLSTVIEFLFAQVLGYDNWALRAWTLVLGTITVPILWLINQRMFGSTVGLWSAALVTFATWHIAMSQWARHYVLQALLTILFVYISYRATETGSIKRYIFAILVAVCLFFTRQSSVIVYGVVMLYVVILILLRPWRPRQFGLGRAVVFLLTLLLLTLIAYLPSASAYLTHEPYGRSAINVIAKAAYLLNPALITVAACVSLYGIKIKDRRVMIMALLAFTPTFGIALMAEIGRGVGTVTFLSILGIFSLVGFGIAEAQEQASRPQQVMVTALSLALIAILVTQTGLYFTIEHGHRPRVRDTSSYLASFMVDGDGLYITSAADPEAFKDFLCKKGIFPKIAVFYQTWSEPPGFDPKRRTWFVVEDLYSTWDIPFPAHEWVREHASLVHMVPSYFGPRSRSLWIYRYDPPAQ